MNKVLSQLSLALGLSLSVTQVFAAEVVDLSKHKLSYLNSLAPIKAAASGTSPEKGASLKEQSNESDLNQTQHLRLQQMYQGHRVLGGNAIVHTPHGQSKKLHTLLGSKEAKNSTMNGKIYEGLAQDLSQYSKEVFSKTQEENAFANVLESYEVSKSTRVEVKAQRSELVVYVDENNKAHWAFQITFSAVAQGKLAQPSYIIDAQSFKVYKTWNNLKTAAIDYVQAGGFGGNLNRQFIYDGQKGNLASFTVERDAEHQICYMQNELTHVVDGRSAKTAVFDCATPDAEHNNLYWSGSFDQSNGGYSPSNDVMYSIKTINDMYQTWYQLPLLSKNGKPMRIEAITHDEDSGNAGWDDIQELMVFGDGHDEWYPLTTLGITAHELAHGFTSQHSNLIYDGQSGGMNEAFSDMAHAAAIYFSTGEIEFRLGAEIYKDGINSLRYMDKPSKDCNGEEYQCSIDTAEHYNPYLDVHFSSGVYNRAFYLLATSENWDIKKAFDVMVQANRFYWTPDTDFVSGACGVLKATTDYQYDQKAVMNAFEQVGIDTKSCS